MHGRSLWIRFCSDATWANQHPNTNLLSTPFAAVSSSHACHWEPVPEAPRPSLTSTSSKQGRAVLWSKEACFEILRWGGDHKRGLSRGIVGNLCILNVSLALEFCCFQSNMWRLISSAQRCQSAFCAFYNRMASEENSRCLNRVFARIMSYS